MDTRSANDHVGCSGTAQGVPERKNTFDWPRYYSSDILTDDVSPFHPCSKNLPEAKLKGFGLMALKEEVSIQS